MMSSRCLQTRAGGGGGDKSAAAPAPAAAPEAAEQAGGGGKKKEKALPEIVIELNNRNKKKHITVIKGLDAFDVDTAAAAKIFGKKVGAVASRPPSSALALSCCLSRASLDLPWRP